jgi:hypothetical protein
MEQSELIDRINALVEKPMLLECSRRAKRRFGLRGGLLRNLLLSEQIKRSLFDYIDPFSDLDCVVERQEDWPILASSLASSVAYAGFYRWEVQTLRRVFESLKTFPSLPSERLIVWFDGRGQEPGTSVESLSGDLESDLSAEQLPVSFSAEELERPFWDRMLVLLRRMRTLYQFAGDPDVRLLFPEIRTPEIPEYLPTQLTVNRLQTLLASVAMTSIHLPLAIKTLRRLDEINRHAIAQHGGEIWERLVGDSIDDSSRVTASVYGDRRRQRRVDLRVQPTTSANENMNSPSLLIPWTLLRSPYDAGCCEYTDFRFGVGVVAARGGSLANPGQIEAAEIFARPIHRFRDDIYQFGLEVPQELDPLPLPGILTQSSQSLVLRVDHAFPAAYLGRATWFLAGAVGPESTQ